MVDKFSCIRTAFAVRRKYLIGKLYAKEKKPHGTNQHSAVDAGSGGVDKLTTPKTAEKIADSTATGNLSRNKPVNLSGFSRDGRDGDK